MPPRSESEKIRYEKCKELGVCHGHPDSPVVPGKSKCQRCVDLQKEAVQKAKDAGMCIIHKSVPSAPGKFNCEKCIKEKSVYQKIYHKEYIKKNKKEVRKKQKDTREKAKQTGMCTKHPYMEAAPNRKTCQNCVNKVALRHRKQKKEILEAYGGVRCACPGCPNPEPGIEFLTIDHINNDGAEHRRQIKDRFYRWLRKNKYPPGFQVLCFNCNFGKNVNKGTCPHMTGGE